MVPCFVSALKKSTLRRSLCSWCLSCLTMMGGLLCYSRCDRTAPLGVAEKGFLVDRAEIISASSASRAEGGHRIGPQSRVTVRVIGMCSSFLFPSSLFALFDSIIHTTKCRQYTSWITWLATSDRWSMRLRRSATRSNGSSHLKMCKRQRYCPSNPTNASSQQL